MKRQYIIILIALFCILSEILACRKNPTGSENDRNRTLASLQKVDDFPLYVMHYYGDYNFDDVLKEGIRSVNESEAIDLPTRSRWACTCFSALNNTGAAVFGRNFDWYNHPALLLFTDPPEGPASVAMVDISYLGYSMEVLPETNPDRLLNAPFLPFDGMNDHGLAVGIMAVPDAQPPRDSQKVTISSLHAVRLLLDYAKNVNEAVSLLQQYNIDFTGGPPLHYLVSDAARNSIIIEFVNNKIATLKNEKPWQVATNFTISGKTFDQAKSSCWRYNKIWTALDKDNGKISPEQAMTLLKGVSQANTIWSMVYNMTRLNIQVVMGKKYNAVHKYDLKY